MKIFKLMLLFSVVLIFVSCGSGKKVIYLQDLESDNGKISIAEDLSIRVRPGDKLSILIKSKDPLLNDLYNLPYVGQVLGYARYDGNNTSHQLQGFSGYTIDSTGYIDFPVLGKLYVEGMKREEIASSIKEKLMSNNLIKDPIVTVEFINLTFCVMGEVNFPGRFSIDKDKISLLEALSMAKDLTIFGNRENVLVLRKEEGVQKFYRVNLCNTEQFYSSPVYYIRQDDIIYVEPNNYRTRDRVNGNNWTSSSFLISFCSLLISIAVLIFKW